MSFSFDVKEELCRIENKNDACNYAEFAGMLLFAQTVKENHLKISTENVLVINRLQTLSSSLFNLFFEMSETGVTYNASVRTAEISVFCNKLGIKSDFGFNIDSYSSNSLFVSFLRGAVLSGGYFNDPTNRYHFELVSENIETARSMLELLNKNKIPVKMVSRRATYILYLKDSQQIYNLLYKLGARNSAFDFMDIKIEKETNNNNNRMDNCVAYNMDKALNKAVEQVQAIELIEETCGLSVLSEDLYRIAVLRLNNPTSSLNELTVLSNGEVSKASISRKLNKIVEFSKNLKG